MVRWLEIDVDSIVDFHFEVRYDAKRVHRLQYCEGAAARRLLGWACGTGRSLTGVKNYVGS